MAADSGTRDWIEREGPELAAAIRQAQAEFPEFIREVKEYRRRLGLEDLDENDADAVVQSLVDAFYQSEEESLEPAIDVSMIQVYFPKVSDPLSGEKLWVHQPFEFENDRTTATLYSDSDDEIGLHRGQRVTFSVDSIVDWVLVFENELTMGGFTFAEARRRMGPIEREFFDRQWSGVFKFE